MDILCTKNLYDPSNAYWMNILMKLFDNLLETYLGRGPFPSNANVKTQVMYIEKRLDRLFRYSGVEYPSYLDNGKLVMHYWSLNAENKNFHNILKDFTGNLNDPNKRLVVHQIISRYRIVEYYEDRKPQLILLNLIRILLMPVNKPYSDYFTEQYGDISLFDSYYNALTWNDRQDKTGYSGHIIG